MKVINKESKKFDKVTNCLIQVNISKESSKYGFEDRELDFLNQETINEYKNIKFKGLMGMASFTNDESIIKNEFNNLKNIYDNIRKEIDDFNILSMGMSNDYKIALESGSNMIRIGSKIFGKRNYQ